MAEFPGPLFEALGVQSADLLAVLEDGFDRDAIRRQEPLTNGLILELVSLKTDKKLTWPSVLAWISALTGEDTTETTVNWLTAKVNRLKSKRADVLKDKSASSRTKRVEALLDEPFGLYKPQAIDVQPKAEGKSTSSTVVKSEIESECLADLSKELQATKDKLEMVEQRNEVLAASRETYRSKLRNIRKKISRSQLTTANTEDVQERAEVESMLDDLSNTVEHLHTELDESKRKLTNEHHRVYYYRNKSDDSSIGVELESTQRELSQARRDVAECRATIAGLEDQLQCALDASASRVLETKVSGQYTDDVRQCCLRLLSLNVGVRNVAPTIQAVLSLLGMKAAELPSSGLLSQMFVELNK